MIQQKHQIQPLIKRLIAAIHDSVAIAKVATALNIRLNTLVPHPISAAVMIVIVNHLHEPSILLIERSPNLRKHAGQICFPGGKCEKEESLQMCALRELEEELGIGADQLNIVGSLGTWPSYSGYLVTPYIGIIEPPVVCNPCPIEVKGVFEAPLTFILDYTHYQHIPKETPIPHQYYQIDYQNKRIWGFTASMLILLAKLLSQTS